MQPAPEFSSLLVSRPGSAVRLTLRARGLACAATLYAAGVAAVLIAPLFMLEMMEPPRAGLQDRHPPVPIRFHNQVRKGGDSLPAAAVRKGERNGADRGGHAAAARPPRADAPLPPPETNPMTPGHPSDPTGNGRPPRGDPRGRGHSEVGVPGGDCDRCVGAGIAGPGDPEDGPYQPWSRGLAPPRIIPATRALPKYPDLARRAGLQGTVILLIVVEADGTVGEIEVIRSPDQRWGFDLAAIGAVKEWRYEPALMNDRPVAAYIQVMVEFALSR